jgi:putative peptidoglycan lipid II flippase
MTPPGSREKPAAPPGAEARPEAETLYGFAGTVTFFTLVSRVLGMARDLVIADRFGASGATDAWVQAFRIPNALRRLTAEGSMTIAFVPTYVRLRTEQGEAAARAFAQKVLGLVLVATLALTVLGIAFSGPLTAAFSPGFLADPAKFDLAARLLRWCFPYLVLVSLVAWAMGVLNSEGRFAAPAAAPIFLNLGIIVAVLGFSWAFADPIVSVAAGVLVGGGIQVLLQGPSLSAAGVWPRPRLGWRDPAQRRFYGLLLPSLLGVAVYQVNIILLGIIASYLPTGQIFYYNNATRLTELVMGLFTFAFTTAGLPTLSEHQARQDWAALRETLALTFSATLYTILPAMAGLTAAATPIVVMLYAHGAFTYQDALVTADTLQMMALSMPAVAAVRVMVPVFYAFEDARTPVKISLGSVAVTTLLGWWLSQRYEVVGLAAGLSIGTWFQCVLLALALRHKARPLGRWFPWRALWMQSGAALVVGAGVFGLQGYGTWSASGASALNWLIFAGVVLGGTLAYLALTLALGEPEARHWVDLGRRLLARVGRKGPPAVRSGEEG